MYCVCITVRYTIFAVLDEVYNAANQQRNIFFVHTLERQKVVRIISKCKKSLLNLNLRDTVHDTQSKRLDQALEDLRYIDSYPKDQKYISLFRETTDPQINEKRSMIRAQIAAEEARKKREQRRALHDSDSEVDFEGEFWILDFLCVFPLLLYKCYYCQSFKVKS